MSEEEPGPCSWCWNNYKAAAISLQAEHTELLDVLKELRDLVNDMRDGIYILDSFTCQPANIIIAKIEGKLFETKSSNPPGETL